MGPHTQRFLELARMYGLADRHTWVRNLCRLFEQGLLPDRHRRSADSGASASDPLNRKAAPITSTGRRTISMSSHPGGPPDITFGRLEENPDAPIGMHLSGAVHTLLAGRPGFGKTTAIRRMILAVEEYNRRHPWRNPVILICLDRKGQDYGDIPGLLPGRCLHLDVHQTLRLGLDARWASRPTFGSTTWPLPSVPVPASALPGCRSPTRSASC